MTHKTQEGHDGRKYLTSVARLVQCDKSNLQYYQQIFITRILEHLRTAFNVG